MQTWKVQTTQVTSILNHNINAISEDSSILKNTKKTFIQIHKKHWINKIYCVIGCKYMEGIKWKYCNVNRKWTNIMLSFYLFIYLFVYLSIYISLFVCYMYLLVSIVLLLEKSQFNYFLQYKNEERKWRPITPLPCE